MDGARLAASAVELCGDDIDAAQNGDDVAELVVADQVWEHGKVNKGRGSRAGAVGPGFRIANDIEPKFAVGRFCGGVDLFAGNGISAVWHNDLEVLNQPFDAAVDGWFGRQNHIAFHADIHASAGNVFNGLFDDLQAFEEFLHADEVAGIAVTASGADDVEIEIRVGEIGLISSQIAFDTAGACHGTCGAEVDCIFATEVTDAPGAIHKNAVFREQSINFVVDLWKFANEFSDAMNPIHIDVEEHPADSCVAGVETLTGSEFHNVVDVFALLKKVQERCKAPEVECGGAEIQQMVVHPHEFCEDGAKVATARCEFDPQQFLDGVVPGDFVGERRQIIHPVDDGNVLVEVEVLTQFLEATVKVADIGDSVENFLAVEGENEPQGGVSCGVLRAEIQGPDVFAVRRFRGSCIYGSERHGDRRNSQR